MEGLIEGRIVHFVTRDGIHRPAIVVNVSDKEKGLVNLQVFGNSPDFPNPNTYYPAWCEFQISWKSLIPYSEEYLEYTWHWIERE